MNTSTKSKHSHLDCKLFLSYIQRSSRSKVFLSIIMDDLCKFCRQVNFAAILTPRENDRATRGFKTIYRPELTKACQESLTKDWYSGKTVRAGLPEDFLPQIKTARYEDLSDSELSEETEHENTNETNDTDSGEAKTASNDGTSQPLSPITGTIKLMSGTSIGAVNSDSEDGDAEEIDPLEASGAHLDTSSDSGDAESEASSSAATWSGNSHFTENDRIDLKKQAEGNWNYRPGHHYYLGTIWDVRSRRRDCKLCKKFWESMRNDILVKRCFMTKSRCILKLLDFKTRRKIRNPQSDINVMQLMFIYGLKVDDPDGYNWICQTPLIIQAKRPPNPTDEQGRGLRTEIDFDDKDFGLARDCTTTCNFPLFKRWLKLCEHEHDHPRPLGDFDDFEFRLIDTKERCLVSAREDLGDEIPRYVALSYVWGEAQQHRLLAELYGEMFEPEYFSEHSAELPATVRDAMDLVREIGERYLWVDALCIVQDDVWDKRAQIPRMHDIYGSALLTIVAAAGISSEDELAGVRAGGRDRPYELELNVDDVRIVVRESPSLYGTNDAIGLAENYLKAADSKWVTRGWTYQEGLLSSRLLIFHKRQVFWECSCAMWEEQTCWESKELDFVGLRSIKNVTPVDIWTDAFDRRAHDQTSPDEDELEFEINIDQESYPRLVREYTERDLTSPKDIQSAFQGILSSIEDKEGTEFFHGLRHKHFGNDLLFNMTNVLPRRFARVQKSPRRFPIWSWLAWYGQVEIANDARGNSWDAVENLVPCDGVKCYVLREDEGDEDEDDGEEEPEQYLEALNCDGGWRFEAGYVRRGEGIWDPTAFHRHIETSGYESDDAHRDDEHDSEMVEDDPTPDNIHAHIRILSMYATRVTGGPRPKPKMKSPIPSYRQDVNLHDIHTHLAWPVLRPNFHIIFATFVSTVVLRTEWDDFNQVISGATIGGTKKTRGESLWSNRHEKYKRSLYVVRDKREAESSNNSALVEHVEDDEEPCPCCGKVEKPFQLPPDKEQGAYTGHIPPFGKSYNPKEYREIIPDGIYRLLYMNNNQLPMWGHLLVRDELDADGNPTGVFERVCGATGPPYILRKDEQERYGAEWQICVMG